MAGPHVLRNFDRRASAALGDAALCRPVALSVRRKGLPRTHANPLGAAATAAAACRLAGPAAGVGGREYACSRADTSAALVSRLARCEDFPTRPAELMHANVETRTALSNALSVAFELRTVARCSAGPPTSEATRSMLRRRCAGDAGGRRAARAAPCALKPTSAVPLGCAQPESSNLEVLNVGRVPNSNRDT